jgi:hypothetical protein
LREALALEKVILTNLAPTVGFDHPAQQATRARIAALESVLSARQAGVE